jgi:hypothetical protein
MLKDVDKLPLIKVVLFPAPGSPHPDSVFIGTGYGPLSWTERNSGKVSVCSAVLMETHALCHRFLLCKLLDP